MTPFYAALAMYVFAAPVAVFAANNLWPGDNNRGLRDFAAVLWPVLAAGMWFGAASFLFWYVVRAVVQAVRR